MHSGRPEDTSVFTEQPLTGYEKETRVVLLQAPLVPRGYEYQQRRSCFCIVLSHMLLQTFPLYIYIISV